MASSRTDRPKIDPDEFGLPDRRPTPKSDIYSFACTCTEVCAIFVNTAADVANVLEQLYSGQPPFPKTLSDVQVQKRVLAGERAPRPVLMPDNVWAMVELCWSKVIAERLVAGQIARTLARTSLVPSEDPHGRYRPPSRLLHHSTVTALPACHATYFNETRWTILT